MLALLYTGKLNDDNKRRKLNATFKKKKKKKQIVDRNASQYKKNRNALRVFEY